MILNRRGFALLAAAALAACSRVSPGADPVATVQALYAPYLENRNPPPLREAAPWTPELRSLLQRAEELNRQSGEMVIDFDPIIDGQDWSIDAVAVTLAEPPHDGKAVVAARFTNLGAEVEVRYDLVETGGGWLVDNIRTQNWSLRGILASARIAPAPEGST